MSDLEKAARMALEALDLAQDNLRPHGDNCFLRDKGEYDRCFCGKDSLSDYLQSVVEKLDEALAEQPAQQEPVGQLMEEAYGRGQVLWFNKPDDLSMLYTSPQRKPWVGLTDEDMVECENLAAIRHRKHMGSIRGQQISPADEFLWHFARAIEAKLREKNA